MTGFEVYKMYLALKQHFTKENYDYHTYNGKVRASETSFEQRRDRYFFKKLATKYKDSELLNYFVANFIVDPKGYIKSFSDQNYEQWKSNNESLTYKLRAKTSNSTSLSVGVASSANFMMAIELDGGKF